MSRPEAVPELVVQAQRPNDLWTVDFKGWWRTADGSKCHPLTVRDAVSRFILAAEVLPSERQSLVFGVFEHLFQQFGLPTAILSDNGRPFACTRALAGLSSLSAWWVSLGIQRVRSRLAKPQDNGAHERMHLDMRYDLEDHAADTFEAQAAAAQQWREEFNHVRPHEAIGLRTPVELYTRSKRRPGRARPHPYSSQFQVRRVASHGCISFRARPVFVSRALNGHSVGLESLEGDQVRVWFHKLALGVFEATRGSNVQPEAPEKRDQVKP